MTGPAHCTKRMGRSSRCVKWLTLSRPSSPSRRGQASCGIELRMREISVSEAQRYDKIHRTIPHRGRPCSPTNCWEIMTLSGGTLPLPCTLVARATHGG